MNAVEESDALHERVLAFARGDSGAGTFDEIAHAIAAFQLRRQPGFRRLVERRGMPPGSAANIPAVPVEAFRLTRVAAHPPELDRIRFETSGTTSGARGAHVMRTTHTYRELSLRYGRTALMRGERATVVALAPLPDSPCSSSLAFMMLAMMEEFDGRDLLSDVEQAFDARDSARWLVSERGAHVAGLELTARAARRRGEPLLVLATSFALVALLDSLAGVRIALPERSVVMQTGGFKGKTREVEPRVLREATARAFGISEDDVIGEYGMTELTSQLYELDLRSRVREPRLYVPPPWLRVDAVDPVSLEARPEAELGLARFVDLGNVDSAVAVVTRDLVRRHPEGIELCGRQTQGEARGCSLAIEELVFEPGVRP